ETIVWKVNKTLPYVPTMLTHGEHLYFVNDQGIAGCVDAKSGKSLWTQRLGGNSTASPILVDGKIYAINEAGTAYIFAADPHFKLLAKNPIGEPVMATPAVSDGLLYVRGKTHLICIGKKS